MQMHEVKRPGPSHDRSETTPDRHGAPAGLYIVYTVNGVVEHAESTPRMGDKDAPDNAHATFTPDVYTLPLRDVKCVFLERLRREFVRFDAIRIRKTKRYNQYVNNRFTGRSNRRSQGGQCTRSSVIDVRNVHLHL